MTVGERIKKRRKQLKLSADQLAEIVGKDRATIYRYEGDDIQNMPISVITPLAEALNVSPAYLMGWCDENGKKLSSEYAYYPISISAGLPSNVEPITRNNVEEITIPDVLMGKWAGNRNLFIMKVNGESMNRVFPHGSLIAVNQVALENLKDGDIVVYSDGSDYAVKRIYRNEHKIIFRPDSHDSRFTDYVVSDENESLKIHGKVVLYTVELD